MPSRIATSHDALEMSIFTPSRLSAIRPMHEHDVIAGAVVTDDIVVVFGNLSTGCPPIG